MALITIKYIILGIIQGFTEPIPVSSSGHLVVFRELFNTNMFNDINFEVIVNFGSFLAILIIFWKDIINILRDFFLYLKSKDKKDKEKYKTNYKYFWYIVIGTIPCAVLGFIFKDAIEKYLSNIKIVGIAFLITAIALFIVKNIKGKKEDKEISAKDAIIIGLCQAIALFPGLSRSGMTLVGCLLRDFNKEAALKFSFILYFPVSLASMMLSIVDILKDNQLGEVIIPYTLGFIAAGIVTYITTKWFFNVVRKGKLWYFSIYCLLMSLFVLFIL